MSEQGTDKPKRVTIGGGKLLLIIGVLWVAAVIGVYIVVVQLKLGGERGIRLPDEAAETSGDVGG